MSSIASPYVLGHLEGPFPSSSPNIETLETGTPLPNKSVANDSSTSKIQTEVVTKVSIREKAFEENVRSLVLEEEGEDLRGESDDILQKDLSRNRKQTDVPDTQHVEDSPRDPNYNDIIDGPKKGLGSLQYIENEISNRPANGLSQIATQDEMFRMDEDRNLVKSYFHDMLKYINRNDATLADDQDGDLAFFIKQMPEEEMSITFSQWIIRKRNELKNNFKNDVEKKLEKLRKEFDHIIEMVDLLNDDNVLISLAEKLDVSLENAKN